MKIISEDIFFIISNYLNYYSLINLIYVNKNINYILKNIVKRKLDKSALIINKFFYKVKNSYSDLRLKRAGYLINYKRLYKHPELYIKKKIQFVSKFQYHPYNLKSGEIGEGELYYHTESDTWFFDLDNYFYNYPNEECLPLNHLLFKPFIYKKSLRILNT
jgi:hypothetical protein